MIEEDGGGVLACGSKEESIGAAGRPNERGDSHPFDHQLGYRRGTLGHCGLCFGHCP